MKNKEVVSKEVALDDLELFINKFVKKPVAKSELEETYPDVLDAIVDGYLSFDESNLPRLKLKYPIKDEEGNIALSELSFRTRIKPTALASLAKGLNPQKEVFELQLRMTSFIIDQPVAMLDKFERYDYDVLNQVASVFS
jgi:hypothetical protein